MFKLIIGYIEQRGIESIFELGQTPITVLFKIWKESPQFTTIELDELNLAQFHNQYRYSNNIPFKRGGVVREDS